MGSIWPRRWTVMVPLACGCIGAATCMGSRAEAQSDEPPALVDPAAARRQPVERAVAVLRPTSGHFVSGVVRFEETPRGLRVAARVEGLGLGQHLYAVHRDGDCSGADAATAGPPLDLAKASSTRGDSDDQETRRDGGKLGSLAIGYESVATDRSLVPHATLHGRSSIIGRSVVVVAGNDPISAQQGIAGDRLACGVIGIDE